MTTTTTNGTTTREHEPSTAIVRHEAASAAIEPQTMAELVTYADAASKSGFFGAKNKEQALMMLSAGRDLGLSYSQALRAFHVIDVDGRPPKLAISADGMVAVCLRRSDVCEYFRIIESTDARAVVEAKRAGSPPRQASFTVEEAQRAGLVKDRGNWHKYPARMCLARAKSFLARDLFPDLLLGLFDPDELRDSAERPEPRHVEAVPVAAASSPSSDASEPSPAALAFVEVIGRAESKGDLQETARAVADANLTAADRAHVRTAYQARLAALATGGSK